jgi:uncharacterized protein
MSSLLINHWRYLWLLTMSLLAGAVNAMAGGGSFLSFPAMLGIGIPPIEANATNTVALWPGQLTSIAALHGDVRRNLLPTVVASSIVGGTVGAWVLLHTGQDTFLHLIPWLLLIGSLIFGFSERISNWMRARSIHAVDEHHSEALIEAHIPAIPLFLCLLPICFYVGYFGAGGGFLIMTVLALFGMEDMYQLNALKVVAAAASNCCAILIFILSGRIIWHYCLVSMVAAGIGGWLGAKYTRRLNPEVLRAFVVVTGILIAVYFFWRHR